jgi:hypothetical protein
MGAALCSGESPIDPDLTTDIEQAVDRSITSLPAAYTVSYSTCNHFASQKNSPYYNLISKTAGFFFFHDIKSFYID